MRHRKDEWGQLLIAFGMALQQLSHEEYEQLVQGKGRWRFTSEPDQPSSPVHEAITSFSPAVRPLSDPLPELQEQRKKASREKKPVDDALFQESTQVLLQLTNREEARNYIAQAKHLSTKADYERLAQMLGIRIRKSERKDEIIEKIIEGTAGLKANAIAMERVNVLRRLPT
ncbi:hypothetical protein [Heliophilum fasciatum]|uniref:Uncharacterized protein n=1 Tax=Heliophilum fasciatum TaxID=35700 RepID=A0A4R2RBY3_9FIRM|nr:hypothetical protein [Heliophilum fasciatum]MCW2279322.1 hypothetical protein [Heliophilum fasciatum]TCP60303.1 hypothetical protein EDD73_1392 [Heliophilum fasciatum]